MSASGGQPTFLGIKNVSGKDRKIQHGGEVYVFAKDEVRIVDAATAQFLASRSTYLSQEDKNGVPRMVGMTYPFKTVPLAEALKVVKEPENRSVVAARAEVKKEQEMEERILAKLKAAGWQAPAAPRPAQQGQGGGGQGR